MSKTILYFKCNFEDCPCYAVGTRFSNVEALSEHYYIAHNARFHCKNCLNQYRTSDELREHRSYRHVRGCRRPRFQCNYCGREFQTYWEYMNFKCCDHDRKLREQHSCKKCYWKFAHESILKLHTLHMHPFPFNMHPSIASDSSFNTNSTDSKNVIQVSNDVLNLSSLINSNNENQNCLELDSETISDNNDGIVLKSKLHNLEKTTFKKRRQSKQQNLINSSQNIESSQSKNAPERINEQKLARCVVSFISNCNDAKQDECKVMPESVDEQHFEKDAAAEHHSANLHRLQLSIAETEQISCSSSALPVYSDDGKTNSPHSGNNYLIEQQQMSTSCLSANSVQINYDNISSEEEIASEISSNNLSVSNQQVNNLEQRSNCFDSTSYKSELQNVDFRISNAKKCEFQDILKRKKKIDQIKVECDDDSSQEPNIKKICQDKSISDCKQSESNNFDNVKSGIKSLNFETKKIKEEIMELVESSVAANDIISTGNASVGEDFHPNSIVTIDALRNQIKDLVDRITTLENEKYQRDENAKTALKWWHYFHESQKDTFNTLLQFKEKQSQRNESRSVERKLFDAELKSFLNSTENSASLELLWTNLQCLDNDIDCETKNFVDIMDSKLKAGNSYALFLDKKFFSN